KRAAGSGGHGIEAGGHVAYGELAAADVEQRTIGKLDLLLGLASGAAKLRESGLSLAGLCVNLDVYARAIVSHSWRPIVVLARSRGIAVALAPSIGSPQARDDLCSG